MQTLSPITRNASHFSTLAILWLLSISLGMGTACVSSHESPNSQSVNKEAELNQRTATVVASTSWPPSFVQFSSEQATWALLPKEILNLACVKAQSAALREGPGVKFQLKDKLISHNSCVVVTHSSQVWSHVIDFANQEDSQERGWIHSQALDTKPSAELLQGLPETLKIKTENLPTVFTRNIIKYAYDHPKRQAKTVKIPRGVYFPLLLASKEYALLWIQDTNSVMWLKLDQLDASN